MTPMERAIRALAAVMSREVDGPEPSTYDARMAIGALARLRTSDPDAFAAVLAECGVVPTTYVWCTYDDTIVNTDPPSGFSPVGCGYPHEPLYRVKPERSDRHTEDAS